MNHFPNLFLFFVLFFCISCGNESKPRPNIILIMADDLGSAELGCYGNSSIKTPHLDQLALGGIKFTQAYSGNTVCAPARATLLTGLHSGHNPVRGNTGGIALPDETLTMAEVFQTAGYATGGFGKWGLGEWGTSGVPEKQGFDRFFGYYHQIHAHDYYPAYLWENSKKIDLPAEKGASNSYSSYRIFEEMKQFIQTNAANPFFCYAPWTAPHNDFTIPTSDPNLALYTNENWTEERKNYAAMVSLLDQQVGALIELLTQLNLLDNTLILFCSDNGGTPLMEEYAPNGSLRGYKRDLYEGGIRVPMIASWPKVFPKGSTFDHPIYFPDLFPTLVEAAGIQKVETKLDGKSFFKWAKDPTREWKDRFLYWEYPAYDWDKEKYSSQQFKQALRYRQWKMIRNGTDAEWEIYDLTTDPNETDNVSAYHPGKMQKFQEWIAKNRVEAIEQIEPERIDGKLYR